MREGSKIYCKKTIIDRDCVTVISENEWYYLKYRNEQLSHNNISRTENGKVMLILDDNDFGEYFYTEKELRKLKLEQINEKGSDIIM